jgi:RNA-directed DNA polymerase
MQNNIPMDKEILRKWLTAGYIDNGTLHHTTVGTPQGGIASPTLLNMTLSGLEDIINLNTKQRDKINISIYADDFIITGASKEVLEQKVKPAVEAFLGERGLELSKEKTKITHIDDGFDFLGFNIRKYKGKLIIKPSKNSIKSFLSKTREIIKSKMADKTEILIHQLNQKIRGWANYFRSSCAKKSFGYIDHRIFELLWRWIKRRHPHKSVGWRKKRYFRQYKLRKWIFYTKTSQGKGPLTTTDLMRMCSVPIIRHVKIKKEAIPFDPKYKEYFEQRENRQKKLKYKSSQNEYGLIPLVSKQTKCGLAGSTDVGL